MGLDEIELASRPVAAFHAANVAYVTVVLRAAGKFDEPPTPENTTPLLLELINAVVEALKIPYLAPVPGDEMLMMLFRKLMRVIKPEK
jgi:hypothetical protein